MTGPMGDLITGLFSSGDERLMWRVKLSGDAQAFGLLMGKWQKPIQRLCERMTGDAHRAEDLAQVAFARVFTRRADWRPSARFSTFLWRIALNLCHDELRRRNRRTESSLEELQAADEGGLEIQTEPEPGPDAQAETRERNQLVRAALLELAPHYREVVLLRHYEDLKFRQIAAVLGIPEGTVKSRMAEALTQLQKSLKCLSPEPCAVNSEPGGLRTVNQSLNYLCNPQISKPSSEAV